MQSDVKAWLLSWFESNTEVARTELEENVNSNYFDKEYIDSFEFISLIADIEDEFGISFDNDQFEDRSFSTINGLVKIIEGLLNK